MANRYQQCHTVLHHGLQFVRLVADPTVMRNGNPLPVTYLL